MQLLKIIALFFILFSRVQSLAQKKVCVNCQYFFIPENADAKFGKCFLFPKTEENLKNYLVTGTNVYDEYKFCSKARDNVDMCGARGSKYRKNYTFKK
jgi:hypothetical protein